MFLVARRASSNLLSQVACLAFFDQFVKSVVCLAFDEDMVAVAGCPTNQQAGGQMPGKRIQIDDETWHVLVLLARDRMMTFQELADEAFAELLKKYDRPVTLKAALRKSADLSAEIVPFRPKPTRSRKSKKGERRA